MSPAARVSWHLGRVPGLVWDRDCVAVRLAAVIAFSGNGMRHRIGVGVM